VSRRFSLAPLGLLTLVLVGPVPAPAQAPATTSAQSDASPPETPPSSGPLDPASVVGPPGGTPLTGPALDARTIEVASLLRCPVCQGLSVADSPATMAVSMKGEVRDMLWRGFTEEQILAYFEGSYGEFVRLAPPLRGVNWLVWFAPLLALVLGGLVVARTLRGRSAASPAPEGDDEALPGRDTLPRDPELAAYVRRVREMAYGWPDGEPPSGDA